MYSYKLSKHIEIIFKKLSRKDKKLFEQVLKKIDEVVGCYDLTHYKNLKYDLKDCKKVHLGHFVLVFKFDEEKNMIYFVDFDHHDNIYLHR